MCHCGCGKPIRGGTYTWASPDDGHAYRKRCSGRDIYELVMAVTAP